MAGFLDALKMRCEVVQVDGGRDFRRLSEGMDKAARWHSNSVAAFEMAWDEVTAGRPGKETNLIVAWTNWP